MEQIGDIVVILLVVIVIQVIVFILIREIIMWYWKINRRIELQEKTNSLLQLLVDRSYNNKDIELPVLNQAMNQHKQSKSLNEIIREQKME